MHKYDGEDSDVWWWHGFRSEGLVGYHPLKALAANWGKTLRCA